VVANSSAFALNQFIFPRFKRRPPNIGIQLHQPSLATLFCGMPANLRGYALPHDISTTMKCIDQSIIFCLTPTALGWGLVRPGVYKLARFEAFHIGLRERKFGD
jgi:hypothetical protein